MTHIVKNKKGRHVQTWCGKTIPTAAAGSAKSRGRVAPFIVLDTNLQDFHYSDLGATLEGITQACEKCMDIMPLTYKSGWFATIQRFLKDMELVHIMEKNVSETAIKMLCGKMWAVDSLFRNKQGYITKKDFGQHYKKANFCKGCLEHPEAALLLLAETEL